MSSAKKYDVIVIGSGLTGVLSAHLAHRAGKKVLLLEARDIVGGAVRRIQTDVGALPSSLEFFPENEISISLIQKLSDVLGVQVLAETEETRPLTFDEGHFKPFVGFGDRKNPSIGELSFYNNPRSLKLLSGPDQWLETLLQLGIGDVQTLAEVTHFEVSEHNVTTVTINAANSFTAPKIIFAAPPKHLDLLFKQEDLAPKTRSRIAKSHVWTSVGLHLHHKQLQTQEMGLHFLMGSSEEFEPCVGRFFTPEENGQKSCWISLIPEEKSEDVEFIADTIKYMKRQIKRAYHEAFENLVNEKIVVAIQSHGHMQLKLDEPSHFHEIKNFFVASPLVVESRGLVGALEQGFKAGEWAAPTLAVAPAPAVERAPEVTAF